MMELWASERKNFMNGSSPNVSPTGMAGELMWDITRKQYGGIPLKLDAQVRQEVTAMTDLSAIMLLPEME
jgi:hypothetical protein